MQNMVGLDEKVNLVEYNPEWRALFKNVSIEIESILKENCLEIHHIGSTAIPYIYSKPIVDVLIIVKNLNEVDSLNQQFNVLGYVCMGEYGIQGRRFYYKSKTKRTLNIHLFEKESPEILRYISFKEFMLTHNDYAKAYSLIKQSLAKVFPYDRENYTNGKASFIQVIDYKTDSASTAQLKAKDNIVIESYNPAWSKFAEAEMEVIKLITKQLPHVSIEHIGSTAVPDLSSKPIIDIFITIKSIKEANQWIRPLKSLGYVFWDENPDKNHLRFFKGMPPFGMKRTHHVHIVEATNDTFEHRILFRDILRRDPKIRLEYDIIKKRLSKSHPEDREAYTDMKGEFIEKALRANGFLKPISR